jgi:hypothetical protein
MEALIALRNLSDAPEPKENRRGYLRRTDYDGDGANHETQIARNQSPKSFTIIFE